MSDDESRRVQSDAWDAGYRAAIEDYGTDIPWGGMTSAGNPYLTHEEREAREAHPESCRCLYVCAKKARP